MKQINVLHDSNSMRVEEQKWITRRVEIIEVHDESGLNFFEVYNLQHELLGVIYPVDQVNHEVITAELTRACPIADAWEDGLGNLCTMQGWGEHIIDREEDGDL